MNKLAAGAVIGFLSLGLMGCASDGSGISKQTGGTLIGAAAGGLLGSTIGGGSGQVAAIAIGAVAGGFVGNQIGKGLDEADQAAANQEAQRVINNNPTGTSGTWRNPDNGNSATFTPVKTYKKPSGRYCREYTSRIVVAGKVQEGYGTACRQPDGTWQIVK